MTSGKVYSLFYLIISWGKSSSPIEDSLLKYLPYVHFEVQEREQTLKNKIMPGLFNNFFGTVNLDNSLQEKNIAKLDGYAVSMSIE